MLHKAVKYQYYIHQTLEGGCALYYHAGNYPTIFGVKRMQFQLGEDDYVFYNSSV